MGSQPEIRGPDLGAGVPVGAVHSDATFVGHFKGEEVLLVRHDDEIYAVGARCSHYGAPLDQGLLVDGQLRCPWHHAGFCVRDGRAERAPGLTDLLAYEVEVRDGVVRVLGRRSVARRPVVESGIRVVVVGGGAAGAAAVETLRRRGHTGSLTMIDANPELPVDRPNLSKDFLAGTAPEEWLFPRGEAFYVDHDIRRLHGEVTRLQTADQVVTVNGEELRYDALLLAPGAAARELPIPGAQRDNVHTLRSVSDCRRLIATAAGAHHAVVIGAGFLGLEAAGALRSRGLEVTVVAPEDRPFVKQLGHELGLAVQRAHEANGVVFALGSQVSAIHDDTVQLSDGRHLPANLVLIAVGAVPRTALARDSGLDVAAGILVDTSLATSAPGVWAAGDAAAWWSPRFQTHLRSEHWVTAQRMGQRAAENMLGADRPFDAVPFFWTVHGSLTINWVGHPVGFDAYEVEGSIAEADCAVTYRLAGRVVAVATIGRDIYSLEAEVLLEASPDR